MRTTNQGVRGVVFDYDGPCCDSMPTGLIHIREIALSQGLPFTERHVEYLIRNWGLRGDAVLAGCFDLSPDEALSFYRAWSEREKGEQPQLISGARETFNELRAQGVVKTILTSRPSWALDHSIDHHRVREYFTHIATTCGSEFHKPDPRAFNCTIDMFAERNIGAQEIVFVGDTFIDWNAGQARGITTFVVRSGPFGHFSPSEWNLEIPPEHIIESTADLPARLKELDLL